MNIPENHTTGYSASQRRIAQRGLVRQILLFLFIFAALYFGTLLMIGLASPENWYSPTIAKYFDYVSWLKKSLIWGSQKFLGLFGYTVFEDKDFVARINTGHRVMVAYDCVGYGVYSIWLAYILSNDIGIKQKLIWSLGGLLLLWSINVVRISLVLLALSKGWDMPLGIDHHTWFNIAAYLLIFGMLLLVERSKNRHIAPKA